MKVIVIVSGRPLFPTHSPIFGLPEFITTSISMATNKLMPPEAIINWVRTNDGVFISSLIQSKIIDALSRGDDVETSLADGRHIMAITMQVEQ
jgi:hypothetical protein